MVLYSCQESAKYESKDGVELTSTEVWELKTKEIKNESKSGAITVAYEYPEDIVVKPNHI